MLYRKDEVVLLILAVAFSIIGIGASFLSVLVPDRKEVNTQLLKTEAFAHINKTIYWHINEPKKTILINPQLTNPWQVQSIRIKKRYNDQDIMVLSKMVYGEARGCAPDEQKLCVWVVINRLKDGRFGDTITQIVTTPYQFAGYDSHNPVTPNLMGIVKEVMADWDNGKESLVLPPYANTAGYKYFTSKSSKTGKSHNYFR